MRISSTQENRREWLVATLLVLSVSALSYLLLARRLGFYFDDWYLAYAGYVEGSAKFSEVFASDRPFRAYFVGAVFDLFGLNAPLYSYLSYFLRIAGAFGLFSIVRMLWPRQKRFAVLMAVLLAIYPGWTDQPAAFDYQSHLLSFSLMVFSITLAVKALLVKSAGSRVALVALAVLLQVASLLLMEYYIGMEGLRLALVLFVALRDDLRGKLRPGWPARLGRAGLAWLPYLAGAGGFLFWRVFLFSSTRAATDITGMFSGLLDSPARRAVMALIYLFRDYFNVSLLAWFVPLHNLAYTIDMRPALTALLLGLAAAGLVWAAYRWLGQSSPVAPQEVCAQDGLEMFWIGSAGVLLSLVPIVLGDRHVVFMTFTRFTLPGSVGAVLLLGGLLIAFTREWLRTLVPVVLIGFACIFHYSNAVKFAEDWQVMRDFWWQVSWRAPHIAPDTVLAASYASAPINEDYFVWGPANLIYYPTAHEKDGLTYTPLGAVVLTPDTVLDITLHRSRLERERRGLLSPQDLDRVLVLDMPTAGSCVEVIDGRAPEVSDRARDRIFRIAPASDIDLILPGEAAHTPPAELFGPEPEHGWCYYYQKASLARQQGDWAEAARLGDEARARDLRPAEWVEWMPFAQAYAYLDRPADVDGIARLYTGVPFLRDQACRLFSADAYGWGKQFPAGQAYLVQSFCE